MSDTPRTDALLACYSGTSAAFTYLGELEKLAGKRPTGRGARTITYKGKQYRGVLDAMQRLKIGKDTLYKLLDSGQARRE